MNRARPSGPAAADPTRLLSSRDSTTSSMRGSSQTAAAASIVHEPGKTDRRRKADRSCAESRSWLHAIAVRRSRCRAGASRGLEVSTAIRRSSRKASSLGVNMRSRAAASSSASGRPSRPTQMSTSARAEPGVRATAAGERSISRATAGLRPSRSRSPMSASDGIGRGGTATSRSAERCRRSRLVASTLTPGSRASRSRTAEVTSVALVADQVLAVVQHDELLPVAGRARDPGQLGRHLARVPDRRQVEPRDRGHAPRSSAQTSIASRVFPTPGGPVRVTSRDVPAAPGRARPRPPSPRARWPVRVGDSRWAPDDRRAVGRTAQPLECAPCHRRRTSSAGAPPASARPPRPGSATTGTG